MTIRSYDARLILCGQNYAKISTYKEPIVKYSNLQSAPPKRSGKIILPNEFNNDDLDNDLDLDDELIRDIYAENMARKKSKIKLLSYCNFDNQYTTMMTLTYKANIKDLDQANHDLNLFKKRLNYWLNKYEFPFKGFKFKYIVRPEFQERGAIHYHLVTNLAVFPFTKTVVREWKQRGTLPPTWDDEANLKDIWAGKTAGKGSARLDKKPIGLTNADSAINYVCGYMCKDIDDGKFQDRKSYWTSEGMIQPRYLYNDYAFKARDELLQTRDIKKEYSPEPFTPMSYPSQTITSSEYIFN